MVIHSDKQAGTNLSKLSAREISAINSRALAAGRQRNIENLTSDDLIVTLADAYENRRARQVGEWESRQRAAAAF